LDQSVFFQVSAVACLAALFIETGQTQTAVKNLKYYFYLVLTVNKINFMYQDKFYRSWSGPFQFNSHKISSEAPSGFGVYQVLKKDSSGFKVMYIGIATGKTIRQRLLSHYKGIGNKNIGSYGNTSQFMFVFWLCDLISAKQIESHVISDEKPPFNVKNEYKHYIPNITVH
jgi:transposase-like protein